MQLNEDQVVDALAGKIRKTKEYALGIGRATALYKARGDYKAGEAYKMALHLVTQMGKKFYGPKYFDTYTPEVRLQVQKKLAQFAREDTAKHNPLLPKKYQKGFKGYGSVTTEAEEEGASNFATTAPTLAPKKIKKDSGYVDKTRKVEPDVPEDEPEYSFTLGQVQAYYDMQVAQGLTQIEAVLKLRVKFGMRQLKIDPTGTVLPVPGLRDEPAPAFGAEGGAEGGAEEPKDVATKTDPKTDPKTAKDTNKEGPKDINESICSDLLFPLFEEVPCHKFIKGTS